MDVTQYYDGKVTDNIDWLFPKKLMSYIAKK